MEDCTQNDAKDLGSYKNVNKPAFKHNDFQRTHREKPVSINVALWLSVRSTSLNMSQQALMKVCVMHAVSIFEWHVSLVDLVLYILQKHVDVIKGSCFAVKSVNRESEGGKDTKGEEARKEEISERT